jgi:hypothetical protein
MAIDLRGRSSVSFYDTYAEFPLIGSDIVLYVDRDTLTMYLWNGTAYELFNSGGGGSTITPVANYDALPDPTTVPNEFYWCSNPQGTYWLPGSLGGTYRPSGLYYSNAVSWEYTPTPYNASQAVVDAGTNDDQFVTPKTLETKPLAVSRTGTSISFDKIAVYNSSASPATGNITNDLTGARIGVVQKIYHNNSVAPTFPAGWVKIEGDYVISIENIIFAEWISGTRVEYWVVNDAPSGFVPYTGATTDVDLGEFELKAGQVELDQTPTGTAGVAVMRWNDTDGTVDLGLKGGNVTLQVGQEQVLRVVNKTATNINLLEANYQAVRVTGAQGQRLKVDLAQATDDALSAETIGLVTETINNNQEGFITTSGIVRGINTTGSLQSETWADGDVVYLSPTTAGNITNIKPSAPNHLIIIGFVVSAHATQGSIFVKVDNGYELDELHNVLITTPLNNQSLVYETSSTLWKNKDLRVPSCSDG